MNGNDLRANPIPATMVGIGVVGLAWLVFSGKKSSRKQSDEWERSPAAAAALGPDYASDDVAFDPRQYGWIRETANGYTPGLAFGETDALLGLVGSRAAQHGSILARARHYWHSANRLVRRRAWNAQARFHDWLKVNPLLVGAAAALVGAAIESALIERERQSEAESGPHR